MTALDFQLSPDHPDNQAEVRRLVTEPWRIGSILYDRPVWCADHEADALATCRQRISELTSELQALGHAEAALRSRMSLSASSRTD